MSKVVVANERFLAEIDGEYFDVVGGDLFEAEHPLPKKHPQLFHDPVFKFPVKAKPVASTAAEPAKTETPKALSTASLKSKGEELTDGRWRMDVP